MPLSLDFSKVDSTHRIELAAGLTAEEMYDREWATILLGKVLDRLAHEFQAAGKASHFETLKGFVIGDFQQSTYRQAASDLGISEDAAKQAASRMRRRYREILRQEIAETVARPDEVDDEIRGLIEILSR